MRVTVADVKGYIEAVLSEYPGASEGAFSYLAEELNAVQQLYFQRFHHETAVYESSAPTSDMTVTVNAGAGMAKVEEGDVLAVFFGGEQMPYMTPAEFFATKRPAYTFYDEKIALRNPQSFENIAVTVIYRKRPADVVFDGVSCSGAVYIPQKHLPLLSSKLKECAARAAFEYKDADYYAAAYNNWVNVLDGYENGNGSAAARARAAL